MTGHAPLAQYAKGLQRQRGRLGNGSKKTASLGLLCEPLRQRLMGSHVLGGLFTTRQHNQVEWLGQYVDQHTVGGQAHAAGTGQHTAALDTGNDYLYFSASQHVDQNRALQGIHAFGDNDQGSMGHELLSAGICLRA
ncbi:hypothetical protein D3C84_915390 [compost metagenome]